MEERAAAKEAKAAPEGKVPLAAVNALDKGLEATQGARNEKVVAVLEAAWVPLSTPVLELGVRSPQGGGGREVGGGVAADSLKPVAGLRAVS